MIFATFVITAYSAVVWGHHMFATGAVFLSFFAATTFIIAIPTGIKCVNCIGTMWHGRITLEMPMLFSVGFLATFLLGGLSGILLASPPLDFHLNDTYFVVAHFHYVLFGTIVFSVFSALTGVGDVLPATPAQLHRTPPDQVRTAGIRAPLPPPRRALSAGGTRARQTFAVRGGDARGRP